MRQTLPSNRALWRSITDDVPDYIPVEFERYAAPAVVQPDGLVERITQESTQIVLGNSSVYSQFIPNIPSTSYSSYTLDLRMNELDHARQLLEQMTEANSVFSSTTQYYTNDVERLRVTADGETMIFAEQSVEEESTIDDSELIEPEPITKRKIVRRKKERPMFWKEETVGEITTLPALIGTTCANLNNIDSIDSRTVSNPSSAFVKMIPLKVLTNSFDISYRNWSGYSASSRIRSYQRNMNSIDEAEKALSICDLNIGLSQTVNNEIMSGRLNTLDTVYFKPMIERQSRYFIQDRNLVNVSYSDQGANSFDHTPRAFKSGQPMSINARTFNASLSQLTCFLETERWSRVFIPQVVAIVLPENYVYQKQHVLVHGTIDLSKVIVLVNKELDDTDFHNKNFRAYYRKHLLPILNQMKVEVWKVPVSFIQENCFHGGITLEATSFMDKKKETERIYDYFRNQYSHIDLDPYPEDEHNDEDNEDYDEDNEDEEDDY